MEMQKKEDKRKKKEEEEEEDSGSDSDSDEESGSDSDSSSDSDDESEATSDMTPEERLIEKKKKAIENQKKRMKERKNVRKDLFKQRRFINENRRRLSKPSSGRELGGIMDESDKIFEKIRHSREAKIDSTLQKKMSDIALKQVEGIYLGKKFDIGELLKALQIRYKVMPKDDDVAGNVSPEELAGVDWEKMGRDVSKFFKKGPKLSVMNGPVKMKKKVRKITRKRKVPSSALTKAKEMEGEDNREESSKWVIAIDKKLRRDQKFVVDEQIKKGNGDAVIDQNPELDFFDFIVNTNENSGFTKTIENFFYYSFLVKEGKCGLRKTKNSKTLMVSRVPPGQQNNDSRTLPPKQSIFKLDLDGYNKIKEKVMNARKRKREDDDEESEESEVKETRKPKRKRRKTRR